MIARTISTALTATLPLYPVLSLTGPRQAGKTTLLRALFPQYRYINLEDRIFREFATEDTHGFLNQYRDHPLIIDEAQNVPELFSAIQVRVDENRQMGQYILSGSQNFNLLQNITQSLAGRVAIFKLFPFDFSELQIAQILSNDYSTVLYKGFYPALYDRPISPTMYYQDYIETYIERDVRALINIKDLRVFRQFLQLCAGRTGQLLNLNSLANDCGISQPTAKAWLSILEASYIVYLLPPYHQNFNKRIVKSPKLYFYDVGIVCNLLGIQSSEQIFAHYHRGNLFENLIISDIYKQYAHRKEQLFAYFWRDSHDNEIDLLIETPEGLLVYEIKSSQTFTDTFLKGIRQFQKTSAPIRQSTLVYGGHETFTYQGVAIKNWQPENR
jgi:uncharacterized protein